MRRKEEKKMKLYDLKENYKKIAEYLYEEELDDSQLQILLCLIDEEIEEKADNYAKLIQNLNSDIASIKEEEDRLAKRRKMLENKSDLLKQNLKTAMEETNKTKFKTALFSFNICANGGKQPIEYKEKIDFEKIEKRFIKPELNKEEVRIALEDGEYLEFAKLMPRGTNLRIK